MAFTQQEKGRILHHLGYPNWQTLAASIQLGIPTGSQPLFLIYQAFQAITDDGEEAVRRDLCQCEATECQIGDARSRFRATAIGEIKLNPQEIAMLDRELQRWRRTLADDLGVVPNPYSQINYYGAGGGINAKVG